MDKLAQQAPQSFRARLHQTSVPKEHRILVLKTGIAGLKYHIKNDEEMEALANIAPGDELLLYREPDNARDEWAIAVYRTETDQLGYITRFKNEAVARLMDAGKKFVCIVDETELDPEASEVPEWGAPRKRAYTENMDLPFSVYLVEQV